MKLTIEIQCDNDAFENTGDEIGRILTHWLTHHLPAQLNDRDGETPETRRLYDLNGNKVGKAVLS